MIDTSNTCVKVGFERGDDFPECLGHMYMLNKGLAANLVHTYKQVNYV